jgi:hypothetical protein
MYSDTLSQLKVGGFETVATIKTQEYTSINYWDYQAQDYNMKIMAGYSNIGYVYLSMEIYNKSEKPIKLEAYSFTVKTDQKYALKYLHPTRIMAYLDRQAGTAMNKVADAGNQIQQAYANAPVKMVTDTNINSYGSSSGSGYATGYSSGGYSNVNANYQGNYYGSSSGHTETTVYKDTTAADISSIFLSMEQGKQKQIIANLQAEYNSVAQMSLPESITIEPDTKIKGVYTFDMTNFDYISVTNKDLALFVSFKK